MSHLRTKYLAKLTRFTVYIEDEYQKPNCPGGNLTCWWIGRSTKLQTCLFEQGNRTSMSMRMSVACSGGNPQRFSWHILVDCAFFDNHSARVWWLIVHVLYLVKWQLVVCLFFELVCCVCLFVCLFVSWRRWALHACSLFGRMAGWQITHLLTTDSVPESLCHHFDHPQFNLFRERERERENSRRISELCTLT